jgi:hypothetical protein
VEGVTEYDAFGNPIERNGSSTTATASASTTHAPAVTPSPVAPTPASTTPPPVALAAPIPLFPTYGPSKTTWGERVIGFLIFLVFAAPLGIGGYVAYNAFHTAKDSVEGVAIKAHGIAPATPSTGSAPATPAASGVSLLHASTLRKALASARRDPGGRLTLLRIAPERVNLQLARKGGGLNLVELRADGGRSVVQSPGTPNKPITFARVDVHAPSRLVRQAAHRLGRSTKSIDYVVLNDVFDGLHWFAYFKGGAAFQGDAHGHVTRRIQ